MLRTGGALEGAAGGSAVRVLHVIPAVAPRYGGPSQVVVQMARALTARGASVLVATTDADGPGRLTVPLGRVTHWAGVETVFFPRVWSESFKGSPGLAGWLSSHVQDFDVVHVHAVFSHSAVAAARACARVRVPYVVRPLGSLDPWSLGQRRWRKRLFWRLVGARMLRGAAAVHFTSDDEQRRAAGVTAGAPGVVIPLGVELATDVPRAPQEPPYVLSLGRLHPKKNLAALVEAFAEVTRRPELAPWRLVIAGGGDAQYERDLRALAASQCPGRADFVGWVEGAEKARVLASAALFAMPSHQENFGVAAAEALAAGVPVLVSADVSLAPEVQAAGAGWISGTTRAEIAATLDAALSNAEERASRGRAAAALAARRFRWEAVADALIRLYRQVARGERPSPA